MIRMRPPMLTPAPRTLGWGVLALALSSGLSVARAEESAAETAPQAAAVSSAPVERERVHVLISRKERAEGKNEVALFGSVQVNGKFTEHLGTGLDYAYHAREAFALTVGGTWFARAVQSEFTESELIDKARQQPLTASALLLNWEGHAGLELSPIYGKFAVFNTGVVQFGLYLGSSLGVAKTSVQLRSADPNGDRDRTFGDTGYKPVGIFNAGFRMFFSERLAFKAEIRDTIYSGAVQTINGCTYKNLQAVAAGGSVPATCDKSAFLDRVTDGQIASELVKDPSSDVLNNVSFLAAVSVLF